MQDLYRPTCSAVHRLDARVKLLFTLAFLVFLNLTTAWAALLLFLALALSLARAARLGMGFVLQRSLLAAPFALAALPLVFAGPPPLQPTPLGFAYSPAGLERFAGIAFKSWVSVLAAVVLTAATRFPDLLTGLQQLRLPPLFAAILRLMWRYLFVIGDEAARLLRARAARSAAAAHGRPASGGSLAWRAGVAGGMAGSLFLRSIERSERVYAAMLSRGYHGALPAQEHTAIPVRQRALLALGLLLSLLLWVLGLLAGR